MQRFFHDPDALDSWRIGNGRFRERPFCPLLLSWDICLAKPVAAAPGAVFQQFAEFLHLASAAICEEASAVLIPAFEMAIANPMRIATVCADVDAARFGAVGIAAGVIRCGLHQLARFSLQRRVR
jgi:hypothetical protein